MILVDANILMYIAGSGHPNRTASQSFIDRVFEGEIEAGLDAETLQEILHRYRSINRWDMGEHVFDLSRNLFETIYAIEERTVCLARQLMDQYRNLAARDAIHCAVVGEHGLDGICSFDRDFDDVAFVDRFYPDPDGRLQKGST